MQPGSVHLKTTLANQALITSTVLRTITLIHAEDFDDNRLARYIRRLVFVRCAVCKVWRFWRTQPLYSIRV